MSEVRSGGSPPANILPDALKGRVPDELIGQLIDYLKALSPAIIASQMERSGVHIDGQGNIVGDGNVSINVEGEGGERLAGLLREAWKQSYVLHQLYDPVNDFVGRQPQIERLINALHNGNSVSICGMSGTGKTQLAMLVANRVRDRYPDAQLFLAMQGTLDTPRDPAEALEACVRAFVGSEETLPKSMDELKGRFCNVLRGKRALIVLDNVSGRKQLLSLPSPPPGCAFIVTSIEKIALSGWCREILSEFQAAEARELLLKIVPDIDPDVADRICYLCGYMPLAIRAAGGFLDECGMDAANYAAQLSDERFRLERIDPENVGDLSVEAAFNLSYRRLAPEAARVFRKSAVFQSSFDSSGEGYVCEDPNQLHLGSLEKRSLVLSATIFDSSKRYRLQHLGRLFAERRLEEQERKVAAKRHAEHYAEVLRTAGKLYNQGGEALKQALHLFDKERDNIRTGQLWAEANCEHDEDAARLCSAYAVNGDCLFILRQLPKERIASLEISLACAKRLEQKEDESRQLGSLGRAYVELGDFRTAVKYYEEQLELTRKLQQRTEEGRALNSLGDAYLRLEPQRAFKLYEEALAISREPDVKDPQNEGRALNNLGDFYRNSGEFRRAIEFYTQQVEIAKAIGDLRSEGNAYNSLGDVYSNLGEIRNAIEHHEKSRKIAQEIGTKIGKANILNNLGNVYLASGEARRAAEFYEESMALSAEIGYGFGENMTLANLGEVYVDLGESLRAIKYLEKALDFFKTNGGPRGEGNVLNNLGKAYADLGQPEHAIKCQEQALAIARAVGSKHGEAHVLSDLGEAWAALGQTLPAVELYEQARSIFEQIDDRRGVCITLNNLGKAYQEARDVERAIELHEQARVNFQQVGDRRGEGTALNNLGKDYLSSGQPELALEMLNQALTIARETSNPRGEANVLFNLSLTLDELGQRPQAIAQAEAALELYKQVEHPNAAQVREQLTRWQSED